MNRKNRFDLKNKKTHMVASFMKKFFLVLAIFGMLVATVHADAFLNDFTDDDGNGVESSHVTITGVNGDPIDVPVINRSRPESEA
ncbi:MAG: hypothetical protein V2J08_10610, partial [Desulfotignum sp.]|nr:hypothetical protein [Desulfotignum sp.]